MNIYICGPMRNLAKFNFPAFMEAAATLRKLGHYVFNPAERDLEQYDSSVVSSPTGSMKDAVERGFSLREALGEDLKYICNNADCVILLEGWEKSSGALAEKATAHALDIPVYEYNQFIKESNVSPVSP